METSIHRNIISWLALVSSILLIALFFKYSCNDIREGYKEAAEAVRAMDQPQSTAYCPYVNVLSSAVPLEEGRNSRLTPAGPVLMGMNSEGHLSRQGALDWARELSSIGVTHVLSFHPPDRDFIQALEEYGIVQIHRNHDTNNNTFWNFHYWRGYDPAWHEALLEVVRLHGLNAVAIHCQHGVDRTGNAMAFLLVTVCNVSIADAFYAVVNNNQTDLNGLADVLEEFGIYDRRSRNDPGVSIYTIRGSGMKAYNDAYRTYIRQTILAMQLHSERMSY